MEVDGGISERMDVEENTNVDLNGSPPFKKVRGDDRPDNDLRSIVEDSKEIADSPRSNGHSNMNSAAIAVDGEDRDEEGEHETKLYCTCRAHYDEERMMIACDRCDEWFHALCMNVNEEQAELVDLFICPNCESETDQRTTWKVKCKQSQCTRAALQPLSRFCSERCGIVAASDRIGNLMKVKLNHGGGRKSQNDKAWADRLLAADERLQRARKRESMTVWSDSGNNARKTEWLQMMLGQSEAGMIQNIATRLLPECPQDEALSVHLLPHLEQLRSIESEKKLVQQQREAVNAKLDLLASRTKLLHLAEDRSALLEPVRTDDATEGSSSSKSKKSKSAKKNQSDATAEAVSRGQPRCGYDERLHWDDRQFTFWSLSAEGKAILNEERPLDGQLNDVDADPLSTPSDVNVAPQRASVCGLTKRKCKRHADWSAARGYDFDLDHEAHMRLLEGLSNEMQELESRTLLLSKHLKTAFVEEQQRRRKADEALAQALALEGSRRAAHVS